MSTSNWLGNTTLPDPGAPGSVIKRTLCRAGGCLHTPPLWTLAAAGIGYFLLARLGVALGVPPDGIAVFWPPNAIILCTFLIAPRAGWWAFVLCFLGAEILGDLPAFTIYEAIGFGAVNCLEGMLAAAVLRHLFDDDFRLASSRELLWFVLVGIVGAPGLAALGGAGIYVLGGSPESYFVLWRTWWVGDAVGLAAVAPFVLALWRQLQDGFGALRAAYWIELGCAIALLAAATIFAFELDWVVASDYYRIFYVYPVLVWIALRCRLLGAAIAGVFIASMVAWMAVAGVISVTANDGFNEVFFLQQFLGVTILSTLTLAVLVQETATLNRKLGIELERTRAAREILKAKERAERANEAKTNFLAHMSHELRTPLNAILGFAGSMRHEVFGPLNNTRYRGYVGDIETSAQHLLSLINDLIDISKIEGGRLKLSDNIVSPGEAIDHVNQMLQTTASAKGIELCNTSPAGLPKLRCDERRLHQVFINLIGNALKFSPAGSRVVVSACYEDGALKFVVHDQGVGIPAEKLGSAFTRFEQFSTDPLVCAQGSGLGLYLSRVLVEAHGGEISIESVLNQGTTVTLVFPAARVVDPS